MEAIFELLVEIGKATLISLAILVLFVILIQIRSDKE